MSAMFLNNGVANNSSRKRKMKEVAETAVPESQPPINFKASLPYHPLQPFSSTTLGLDLNWQQQQPQKKNKISPLPFKKSFTALLTEDDDVEENLKTEERSDQLDELIKTHGEQMRGTLAYLWARQYRELQCAVEDRSAKKLTEAEIELSNMMRKKSMLEQQVAHFRAEAQVWEAHAKSLQQTTSSLRAALREAKLKCAQCAGVQEEEGESSFVDPGRIDPVWLPCKACESRAARVMMWPCRHVCVCMECDAVSKACPVCRLPKATSVVVICPP